MEYLVQLSHQMKELAEDGDEKLDALSQRLESLESKIEEIYHKLV